MKKLSHSDLTRKYRIENFATKVAWFFKGCVSAVKIFLALIGTVSKGGSFKNGPFWRLFRQLSAVQGWPTKFGKGGSVITLAFIYYFAEKRPSSSRFWGLWYLWTFSWTSSRSPSSLWTCSSWSGARSPPSFWTPRRTQQSWNWNGWLRELPKNRPLNKDFSTRTTW